MPSPVWKGSSAIHLQPGYPDYKGTTSGEIITLVYGGPYSALLAAKPVAGQTVAGFPYIPVSEVNVKPLGAGKTGPGSLTITLQQDNGSISNEIDQTDELDWTELTKPIEQHPRYTAGATKLTDMGMLNGVSTSLAWIWDDIKNASSSADRVRTFSKVEDPTHQALILDLSKKYMAGITSYVIPAPLARRTTRAFNLTPGTTMGKIIASKPFPNCPDGYIWLTTADRSLRQAPRGKWERVQEWTGAVKWDTDLYQTA